MESIFLKLVNMSITASWLVLAVIAVRVLFRETPKWMLCLLWGMVAFRLVCPFSVESVFSLIPSAEPLPQDIIYTAHPEIHSGVPVIDAAVNPVLESTMTPAELTSANPTQIWSFVLSQVWILGMVLMLLYTLVSYLILKRKVAESIPLRKNIKRCEFIDSPFVLGGLFPVIYLPTSLEKQDWEYVIAHEEAHIQRRDHWWKPFGFLLLSVYWFNPFLWIAYILLCRDIEAACDEKVIKNMDKEALRRYSTALLKASVNRRVIAACPLAFGEVGIKERIRHVMNYRKPSFWMILLSVTLILILTVTLLTDPQQEYDPDKVYPQSILQEPDRIYIDVDGTDRVFEKDSAVYRSLLEVFRVNWWKYTEEGLDTATYSELITPIAPEVLKTTSWRTYRETGDTIVCFQYTENPVIWENAEGEMTSIQTIGFVLPEKTWSEDNTKGFFLISKTDEVGINEGIYTYYYPPELANNFWDFVDTAKLNEVTYVPGKTMSLNDVLLLSEKKEDLLLGHFTGYAYEEKGDPLLYVRTYPINEKWQLMIHHGGGLSKPIAIWLMHSESGKYVDVTKGNEDGAISEFIKTQEPDSVESVFTWYDTYSMNAESLQFWQQHISLPGAKGVTVQEDTRGNIQICVSPEASYETVISGQMIRNVFFTDLTGDGISEICATVSTESNLEIQVYDYALDKLYTLEDPDSICVLDNVEDRLLVLYKRDGWTRGYGQLSLNEGKLIARDIDEDLIPLTQTVSCIDISNRKLICLSNDGDIRKMLTILRDLEGQAEPAPENMLAAARADMFTANVIEINYVLGTKVFCFSEDFRFVWEYGEKKGYQIADSTSLRNFIESATDGVRDRKVAGEPFAGVDSPWNWCANINQSAVESAEVHVCLYTYGSGNVSGSSSSNGTISLDMLRSLTDLLNQIPKDKFIPDRLTSKESYHDLFIDQQAPNASISIIDGVNNLGVILNLRNDKLTMVLTDEMEKVELDSFTYLEPTQVWEIQDPALLKFMKSISEDPPVILYSVGAEYNWQSPVEYSRGNFRLTVRVPEGWDCIQDENGIRCRPESVDSGWIRFEYYPEGFLPVEEDRYLSEGSNEGYPMIISYPSSVKSKWGVDTRNIVWSYTKIQLDQGDYVIRNDGADDWFLEFEDQIDDMVTLAIFSMDE